MPVEFINPSELNQGTYSHVAAVSGGGRTLYVSGQVAMDAAGKVVGQTFAQQAEQVLRNLGLALAAGGAQFHHIVKMNVYVRDLTTEKVKTLRAIRQRNFGGHQPASTLVGTTALVHEDLMLEIECVAVID
ncbi:MAG: RidA family protein [Proteobacteria bacterium]|jgi:enamine deaminase RidA (YjgF/YER057c/UK114 family)|nr:RidA family protein [Pseudomonadota bacterium]